MSRPDPSILRVGDIIAVGCKPWAILPVSSYVISRQIQRRAKAKVSHAMMVREVGKTVETTKVAEAHYPAVRAATLDVAIPRFGTRWFVLRHKAMTPDHLPTYVGWVDAQIGEPYDLNLIDSIRRAIKENGLEGAHQLRIELARREDGSIDTEGDFWICSELCAASFHAVGLTGYYGYDPTVPIQQVYPPMPGDFLTCDLYETIAQG